MKYRAKYLSPTDSAREKIGKDLDLTYRTRTIM